MQTHFFLTMTPLRWLPFCLVLAAHTVLAFTNVIRNTCFTHYSLSSSQNGSVLHASFLSAPHLNDSNYKQILFADSYDKAVLVDACATYCGPCKLIEPILEKCAEKWQDSLTFIKFDVEAPTPNLKVELVLQNAMPRSLPCLLLFRNGKVITKHKGVITEEELDSLLAAHLGDVVVPTTKTKFKGAGYVSMALRDDSADDYMLSGTI
jgi:thioredoxin 1